MNRKAIILIFGILAVVLINLFYFLKEKDDRSSDISGAIDVRSGGISGFEYQAKNDEEYFPLEIMVNDTVNGMIIAGIPFTVSCKDPGTIKGVSYEWQINGELIKDENGNEFSYSVSRPGWYTLKALQKPTLLFDTLTFRVYSRAELLSSIQFDFEIEQLGSVFFVHDNTSYPSVNGAVRYIKVNGDFHPFMDSPMNITKYLVSGSNDVAISILINGKEVRSSSVQTIQSGSQSPPPPPPPSSARNTNTSSQSSNVITQPADDDDDMVNKTAPPPTASQRSSTTYAPLDFTFNLINNCDATGQIDKASGNIKITPRVGSARKVDLQQITLVSSGSGAVKFKLMNSSGNVLAESQAFLNTGINEVLLFDLYEDLDNGRTYTLSFESEESGLEVKVYYFDCSAYRFRANSELSLSGDYFFSELRYIVK